MHATYHNRSSEMASFCSTKHSCPNHFHKQCSGLCLFHGGLPLACFYLIVSTHSAMPFHVLAEFHWVVASPLLRYQIIRASRKLEPSAVISAITLLVWCKSATQRASNSTSVDLAQLIMPSTSFHTWFSVHRITNAYMRPPFLAN